ncbi:MAG: M48 family metallopeptidase [Spirochaetaceae bacterium]|nr:M48 family metallopeptidase [Spirochaetaceae bacterium]
MKKLVSVLVLVFFIFTPVFAQDDDEDDDEDQQSGYTLKDAAKEAWGLYKQYKRLTDNVEAYWEAEIKEGMSSGTYTRSGSEYQKIKTIFDTLLTSKYINRKKYDWRIYLQNTNEINASCAVNGIIIINKGMIQYCKNKDELAIVIGHEIGHMTRNHLKRRLGSGVVKDFIAEKTAAYIAKKKNKRTGDMSEMSDKEIEDKEMFKLIFGLAGDVALLKYSRGQEQRADEEGAKYAASTGFDSNAGYDLWTRMAKDFKNPAFVILSSHPASDKRAKHFLEADYQRKYGK